MLIHSRVFLLTVSFFRAPLVLKDKMLVGSAAAILMPPCSTAMTKKDYEEIYCELGLAGMEGRMIFQTTQKVNNMRVFESKRRSVGMDMPSRQAGLKDFCREQHSYHLLICL